MTSAQATKIHALLVDGKAVEAANLIYQMVGKLPTVKTVAQAFKVCRNLEKQLLESEEYLVAATLLWGDEMFSAEPESVVRVFEALRTNSKVLFMGASSMGKSYSAGAWMYIDWRRDPIYTSVKCVGISEDQVRKHVFAHLVKLHKAAAIPMEEKVEVRDSDMWMGVKEAGYEFGITAIAYKQSQETSGGIKGYKSMPVRVKPHPKFGYYSRLRLLGDEGQNWPNGPFKDINTWVSQIDGPEKVKIAIAFNPESTSQLVVQMAEPESGWNVDDLDVIYDWIGKSGWAVCRLDAALCENVIRKKTIYQGLQTYEGYLGYLKSGGDNSPNYMTFARGFPPMKGDVSTLIPPGWPQSQRGEATFIDNPILYGAVDLAFMGKDTAKFAVARWGLASGWRDHTGKFHKFKDRKNIAKDLPRHVLQIDQIMPMQKHDDTVMMAEEIMGKATTLQIKPEHLIVDKTSIGLGVWSHLVKVWGGALGVSWNEGATPNKIIAEDLEGADDQADGVMSEMWWAFRRWLDPVNCAVLINPIIPPQPIHTQLTTRRYGTGKKGIKVEPKDKWKARNGGTSPDEADALVMLVHVVRLTSDILPGLVEQSVPSRASGNVEFKTFASFKSIESEDSIAQDGEAEKEEYAETE